MRVNKKEELKEIVSKYCSKYGCGFYFKYHPSLDAYNIRIKSNEILFPTHNLYLINDFRDQVIKACEAR